MLHRQNNTIRRWNFNHPGPSDWGDFLLRIGVVDLSPGLSWPDIWSMPYRRPLCALGPLVSKGARI